MSSAAQCKFLKNDFSRWNIPQQLSPSQEKVKPLKLLSRLHLSTIYSLERWPTENSSHYATLNIQQPLGNTQKAFYLLFKTAVLKNALSFLQGNMKEHRDLPQYITARHLFSTFTQECRIYFGFNPKILGCSRTSLTVNCFINLGKKIFISYLSYMHFGDGNVTKQWYSSHFSSCKIYMLSLILLLLL